MPPDASGGNGIPSSASAGDTANGSGAVNTAEIEKLVNDVVSKAIGARMKRLNLEETIAKAVESQLEKVAQHASVDKPADQPAANGGESGERLNLKALDERYRQLEQRFQQEQKARQEAESRARDARYRSEVQAELAKHIGADNPHLKPYMATLYDVEKRFGEENGQFGIKFKRDWGEEHVPLSTGVKELIDTELKHLVQQSKVRDLPPNGAGVVRGNPYQPPRPHGPQSQPGQRVNPLYATIADAVADHRPEVAQQILAAGVMPEKK